MAPRGVKLSVPIKNIQTVQRKVKKGRPKKSQPIKTPSGITISIPVKNEILDVLDTERKVDLNTKIALANEVARSQLLKEPIGARVNSTKQIPKKGRKKPGIVSQLFVVSKDVTTDVKVKGKKAPATTKKTPKKPPVQPPASKKVVTRKRKADCTDQKPKAKQRKECKIVVKEESEKKTDPPTENIIVEADNTDTDSNHRKLFNSPMVVIPTRKTRFSRGKNALSPIKEKSHCEKSCNTAAKTQINNSPKSPGNHCKSPILQGKTVSQPNQIDSKGKETVRLESRTTSTSSISNLSWTHDISSSSTTTCITVSSKDFVCFDKKMPVIVLNNMKNKLNKQQPTVESKKMLIDEVSSSDIETACDQSSLTCSNSLVKVTQLNLSSPSHNSGNTVDNDDKNKLITKDYTQAAENLVRALEKIDMEFINWMYEPEFVSPDFNKLNDKLYNILNSEFCALTHCKSVQKNTGNAKSMINAVAKSKNIDRTETLSAPINDNIVDKIVGYNKDETNNINSKKTVPDSAEKNDENIEANEVILNDTTEKNKNETTVESEDKLKKSDIIAVFEKVSDKLSDIASLSDGDVSSDSKSDSEIRSLTPHSPNDDDDALSLFAESITGIESSKLNVSAGLAPKGIEEYIPEPVQNKCLSPNYTYCPTKIRDYAKHGNTKIICEKQNADSTSIYREANSSSPIFYETRNTVIGKEDISKSLIYNEANNTVSTYKEANNNSASQAKQNWSIYKESISTENEQGVLENYAPDAVKSKVHTLNVAKKPCLIADMYILRPKSKNIIFQDVCYFNIVQKCNLAKFNHNCRYLHHIPDEKQITNILCNLNEENFIKEYMLIRRKDVLMHRYGICFVKVCAERQLTRILVEMALDFINESQLDNSLKVNAVEITLLHLNNIDLIECEDLLKIKTVDGSLLCEVFMQIMTSTQNFTRFKPVFLSLTYFMVNNDRTFTLEVAEQILERVCILPYDESLVRALIQIMRLTSREIFLNSMIVQFEKQISASSDIFVEYVSLKKDINLGNMGRWVENRPLVPVTPPMAQQMFHPAQPQLTPIEENSLFELREGVPLPPSPDTTHLEILNKASEDTLVQKITRTISGISIAPNSQSVRFSPNSSNNEELLSSSNRQNWRQRSIIQNRSGFSSPRKQMQPPSRSTLSTHPKYTRQRENRFVTLGGSPTNYPSSGGKY